MQNALSAFTDLLSRLFLSNFRTQLPLDVINSTLLFYYDDAICCELAVGYRGTLRQQISRTFIKGLELLFFFTAKYGIFGQNPSVRVCPLFHSFFNCFFCFVFKNLSFMRSPSNFHLDSNLYRLCFVCSYIFM